jgi:hypothetical protein
LSAERTYRQKYIMSSFIRLVPQRVMGSIKAANGPVRGGTDRLA